MVGGAGDEPEMAVLADLAGVGSKDHGPLAVAYPSPTTFLSYPLFAANVRILCDSDSWRNRGQSSLATTFLFIQKSYRQEGLPGLYRGGLLYLVHQGSRDTLRFLSERVIRFFEGTLHRPRQQAVADGSKDAAPRREESEPIKLTPRGFRTRLAVKYLIDAMVYPILVASTRTVILHGETGTAMEHLKAWYQMDGWRSLFCGLTASLMAAVLDEVMDWAVEWCIDFCSQGSDVDLADKLLLKFSGTSVVSIFTAPVNYVGVIRRCQSHYPGMLAPEPLPDLVRSLPWRGSVYQFLVFGGIMALNVRLIQWKIQLQNEEAAELAGEGEE